MDSAPNFTAGVDQSAFGIKDTTALKTKANSITDATNGINNDWSKVDSAVGQLAGVADYFSAASMGGPGATAGTQTRMAQQALGGGPQTAADLGKAMLRMSQGGVAQAADQQKAQSQQSLQFATQAQQYKAEITAAQMDKLKSDLALNDAKFQITSAMQKSKDGLDIANLNLKNMLSYALSHAKNAKQLDDLAAQKATMDQVFAYIGTGLGAASSVAAGVAKQYGAQKTPTDNSFDSNGTSTDDLTGTETDAGSNDASDTAVA